MLKVLIHCKLNCELDGIDLNAIVTEINRVSIMNEKVFLNYGMEMHNLRTCRKCQVYQSISIEVIKD